MQPRAIAGRCASRSFDDGLSDRQLRRAAEREFEIIGEALSRLAAADANAAARRADLPHIVSLRNRVAHGGDTIDSAVMWGIVQARLAGRPRWFGQLTFGRRRQQTTTRSATFLRWRSKGHR